MDGFNLEGPGGPSNAPYQYIDPKDIKQYWDFAKHYALGDHLFQTQGSGSFTAHQDLIAGGTMIANANCGSSEPTCAVIDYPSNFKDWGCGASQGTTTTLLTAEGPISSDPRTVSVPDVPDSGHQRSDGCEERHLEILRPSV